MDVNRFLGVFCIIGAVLNIIVELKTRKYTSLKYISTNNIIGSVFLIIGGLILLLGKAKLFK